MANRFSFLALLLVGAVMCSRNDDVTPDAEPFTFAYAARGEAGGSVIDAMVAPEGETVPTTFRLWLAPPGLASGRGDVLHGVMRPGDQRGMTYFLVTFGPVFYDLPATSGSGSLVAIDRGPEADSLPLALTVRSSASEGEWLAEARLANGGRFLVVLDERAMRGEFRRVDPREDTRVFKAMVGLIRPR